LPPSVTAPTTQTRSFFIYNGRALNQGHESAVRVFNPHSCGSFATFDYDLDLSIVLLLRLQYAAERTNAVDLFRRGLINGCIVLCSQENGAVSRERLLERSNRPCPPNLERYFGEGKNDDVADWHHWIPGHVGRSTI